MPILIDILGVPTRGLTREHRGDSLDRKPSGAVPKHHAI